MQRRALLANAGAALASPLGGCLEALPGGESPDGRIDDVVADSPPDLPLVPSVSVGRAESTEDRPMSLAVRWENGGDETVRFGEERSVMFHAARSDDERAHLLSEEYGTWDDVVSLAECWYVSGAVGGDGAYRVGELAPGEAHEVELGLYAASDDCFAASSHRFRTSVSVWGPGEAPDHPPTENWGFVVHVDSTGD